MAYKYHHQYHYLLWGLWIQNISLQGIKVKQRQSLYKYVNGLYVNKIIVMYMAASV